MFEKHIFICSNTRDPSANRNSCKQDGDQIRIEFAKRIHEHNLKGKIRANKCGCLDACELGPALVIYPQNIWYGNVKVEDVDEIFHESILGDSIVHRLKIQPGQWENRK